MDKEEIALQGKPSRRVFEVVTFAHIAQHLSFGSSILVPNIMSDLNLNYTQLGLIGGFSSLISMPIQIAYGIIGRRIYRGVLFGLGCILSSISFLLTGLTNNFLSYFGAKTVGSIGGVGHDSNATSILSDKYSKKNMSTNLSIHYGLAYVGFILSPILLSFVASIYGWRQTYYILAIIPLIAGLLTIFYLKEEKSQSSNLKVEKYQQKNLWSEVKSIIRFKGAIPIIIANALILNGVGMGIVVSDLPIFLKNWLYVGAFETSLVNTIAIIGGVFGTLLMGHLVRKFDGIKITTINIGVCSLLIFLLNFQNSLNALLIIQFFIIGATSFASTSLLQGYLVTIFPPNQRDLMLTILFTVSYGLSPIIGTANGFLIDTYQTFNAAWIFKTAIGSLGFVLLLITSLKRK